MQSTLDLFETTKVIPINLIQDDIDHWSNLLELVKSEYLSTAQNYPWISLFSGGKDSTLVCMLTLKVLMELEPSKRNRHIYVLSSDTLVESPEVIRHMKKVQNQIREFATQHNLPITVETVEPEIDSTFWTLMIGKGYVNPNRMYRWCTDRLKIRPASNYILNKVSENGHAILITGVRSAESANRARTIEKYQNHHNSNLTDHNTLAGAFVFRPIMHLTTDEVWEIIAEQNPIWGGTNRDLIQLYRDADGGECPIVLSKDDAPGCGNSSSRFGCWTCTVVKKDKSLEGFLDTQKEEYQKYQLLVDFRNWLVSIRDDKKYRQVTRRNGKISFHEDKDGNIKHTMGPYTISARKMILDKFLEMQKEYGEELISKRELQQIQVFWTEDLLKLTAS